MCNFSCVATATVSELLKMTRSSRNKHRVYFELKRTVVMKLQFVTEISTVKNFQLTLKTENFDQLSHYQLHVFVAVTP